MNIVRNFFLLLSVCSLFILNGCSDHAFRYDPGIPKQVTGLKAASGNNLVTLSWDGNSVATSYNIYYVPETIAAGVTRSNAIKLTVTSSQQVISGLDNNVKYFFMVTAQNSDGEGVPSLQAASIPGPITSADLTGAWYYHTLVSGAAARWERGTLSIDSLGNGMISDFLDSSGNTRAPAGFAVSIGGDGALVLSGGGAWPDFHGSMGSRKTMMTATYSPDPNSRALTIFQKMKDPSDPAYTIADIMGAGGGQSGIDPTLQGNGPTRFAYHQLSSGANNDWEYLNGKVGQHGNVWLDQYKDITYWDYGAPDYKLLPGFDFFWKVTSFGIDPDGMVTEYWNYTNTGVFNNLFIKAPHDTVFTGRMTADKTVIVGVATRTDANGANPKYTLRIIDLNFKPTDQALPSYTVGDLAGNYKFHKLTSSGSAPLWGYGSLSIAASGTTSFGDYTDSLGSTTFGDTFTLAYYPDPGSDGKQYSDFANFTTPPQDGTLHYYQGGELTKPFHTYYDFWSSVSNINVPSTWRLLNAPLLPGGAQVVPNYYNEHATLSYNKDLLVLTRTEAAGSTIIVGLK